MLSAKGNAIKKKKKPFLKSRPDLHSPLRYSVCVNSEYWLLDPTGDASVAESMHVLEPLCVFGDSHQCSSKHRLSCVTQMCFNTTTLFWSKAELLIINISTEKHDKFHKMQKQRIWTHTQEYFLPLLQVCVLGSVQNFNMSLQTERLSFHL